MKENKRQKSNKKEDTEDEKKILCEKRKWRKKNRQK